MTSKNKLIMAKKPNKYVLSFREINRSSLMMVGGKGANLGELSRIKAIQVPDGFCITTEAYKKATVNNDKLNNLLKELQSLKVTDREKITEIGAKIRTVINEMSIPKKVVEEIAAYLKNFTHKQAFAVRSSATAEDLPSASFAGQQDTYLHVIGKKEILKHISKCWASLFTERAIIYRIQNGFNHTSIYLAVVIQQMVFPQAAGILFTADPITGNRKTLSVDAGFGLGEAMVSGLVNADNYKVGNGRIISKIIPRKKLAVYALKNGGTEEQGIEPENQNKQVLTDAQIFKLSSIGTKIESHFCYPQDIEWCLVNDTFYIVQSRPITTLFPVPEMNDQENHVFVSVGHQQMMTDAMKPLGLSLWQLTAFRPMFKAGGRLFVDITPQLASPASKKMMIDMMGEHDPLMKDAILNITGRGGFIKPLPGDQEEPLRVKNSKGKSFTDIQAQIKNDPAIVADLIHRSQTSIKELKQTIQAKSGTDLFDFILADGQQSKKELFDPQNMAAIIVSMDAATWLNEKMMEWLGEKNAADTLAQSAPNNITAEMGLDLLAVADVIRPYPEIINYLQQVKDDNFLDQLIRFDGGQQARDAIRAFLDKYGVRCAGEIDITKTRWGEKPDTLIPMILNNVKNFKPDVGKRKFEHGKQEALKKEKELLERLKKLPDGEQKTQETRQMISLLRNFAGYREYPKYGIISRFFVYKQTLIKEAARLLKAKIIEDKEDIYYLTFQEFREVAGTNKLDYQIISQRKAEHKIFEKLNPPRVITSDGEIITGAYKRENLPAKAIVGLAVSSGIVEGRARIILNIEDADLESNDILITKFTDPSWTPLFVSIKGLITEVGGLMTHGAVIAREYGLPAIVGVENATTLIKDGQQIRVNGTDGYIEIL